jgi:hypothetical protein
MDRLPKLNDWPEIDLKHITNIVHSVLEKLVRIIVMKWSVFYPRDLKANSFFFLLPTQKKLLDKDDLFASPVIETYPEIAEHYLSLVQSPMDFRTIEEERVQTYRSIVDFQEDLISIFRNCCIYNDVGSPLFIYGK